MYNYICKWCHIIIVAIEDTEWSTQTLMNLYKSKSFLKYFNMSDNMLSFDSRWTSDGASDVQKHTRTLLSVKWTLLLQLSNLDSDCCPWFFHFWLLEEKERSESVKCNYVKWCRWFALNDAGLNWFQFLISGWGDCMSVIWFSRLHWVVQLRYRGVYCGCWATDKSTNIKFKQDDLHKCSVITLYTYILFWTKIQ